MCIRDRFYGPIVGAIVVTLINSMLSDYTDASILYVGLIFLSIVMFAPRGLAGGIEQVRVAWREGQLTSCLPGWLTGAAAVVLIATGLSLAVELLFHWRHGSDSISQFFGMTLNETSVWQWGAVVALVASGITLMRATRTLRESE